MQPRVCLLYQCTSHQECSPLFPVCIYSYGCLQGRTKSTTKRCSLMVYHSCSIFRIKTNDLEYKLIILKINIYIYEYIYIQNMNYVFWKQTEFFQVWLASSQRTGDFHQTAETCQLSVLQHKTDLQLHKLRVYINRDLGKAITSKAHCQLKNK